MADANTRRFSELKVDDNTYQLFRMDARPIRPEDRLDVYKYAHEKDTFGPPNNPNWAGVLDGLGLPKWPGQKIIERFQRDGRVNIPLFCPSTWSYLRVGKESKVQHL